LARQAPFMHDHPGVQTTMSGLHASGRVIVFMPSSSLPQWVKPTRLTRQWTRRSSLDAMLPRSRKAFAVRGVVVFIHTEEEGRNRIRIEERTVGIAATLTAKIDVTRLHPRRTDTTAVLTEVGTPTGRVASVRNTLAALARLAAGTRRAAASTPVRVATVLAGAAGRAGDVDALVRLARLSLRTGRAKSATAVVLAAHLVEARRRAWRLFLLLLPTFLAGDILHTRAHYGDKRAPGHAGEEAAPWDHSGQDSG
jgi:hypothetical protein